MRTDLAAACKTCGAAITLAPTGLPKRFCAACAHERRLAQNRRANSRYWYRHSRPTAMKPGRCVDCYATFPRQYAGECYCPSCRERKAGARAIRPITPEPIRLVPIAPAPTLPATPLAGILDTLRRARRA